jgi:hypothetical protein
MLHAPQSAKFGRRAGSRARSRMRAHVGANFGNFRVITLACARRTAAFAAFRPMWDRNRAQSLLRTFAKIGGIRWEQPSYSAFS